MEELGLPSDTADVMFSATSHGQLELVRWIYERHGRNATANLFEGVEILTALEAAA
jgi:hypothetical protein